jgi:pimeloyl-ACP methyl ester carboxylesterase
MQKYLLIFLFLFVSCNHGSSQFKKAHSSSEDYQGKDVVIFIPGFYGSKLVDPNTDKIIWMNFKNALFNSKSLVLPGLGFEDAAELKPKGILKSIPIIPYLYTKDIYGEFLDYLYESLGRKITIVEFSYDWRLDISKSAHELNSLVQKIHTLGAKSVSIVAHSMGGLVTNYFLRYGGQELEGAQENWSGHKLIKQVVIAATPFKGTISIFKDTFAGIKFGLNTSLLSNESFSSFPSTYQLMGNFNLYYKNSIINYFQFELWEENNWALLNSNFSNFEENKKSRHSSLKKYLLRGKLFQELIHAKSNTQEKKKSLLHIKGHKQESPHLAFWDPKEHKLTYKTIDLIYLLGDKKARDFVADGDGLVTLSSAELPKALEEMYKPRTLLTEYEHTEVLNDPKIRKSIVDFLNQ